MDRVARVFDEWAAGGRAELMEREHGRSVARFLDGVRWRDGFTFLDVGCGNGWVVRRVAREEGCRAATGIDKSRKMVGLAERGRGSARESYVHGDVESMRAGEGFDYAFAMESVYYARSVPAALESIFGLLRPGGEFFCGTDFYAENAATAGWPGRTGLEMHLYSRREWRGLFRDAGFEARTRQVRDPLSRKKWKRELGTLFVTGRKP